jgi:hypothetical protein
MSDNHNYKLLWSKMDIADAKAHVFPAMLAA